MKRLIEHSDRGLYEHVTGHVAEQIAYFMADSLRHDGAQAVAARDRAYGLYLGWRSFAPEMTDPSRFSHDDRCLEEWITRSPQALSQLSFPIC